MASPQQIRTPITDLFKINHPILLAGMNVAAGPKLAAAVTNAGGMGVIGGVGYTPEMLKEQIAELKSYLNDKNAPFGVDLLIPQVGGSARKTNYDYTKGKLNELTDIIIESGAKLFVSAVGVPPKAIVDKLHKAGILYMNMIGHVKHVQKCIDVGVDIICAQGGEGGGHTGDIPTTVLIPAVVDICSKHKSPLTGGPVQMKELAAKGVIPYEADLDKVLNGGEKPKIEGIKTSASDDDEDDDPLEQFRPFLMGKAAAVVNEQKPAKAVVDEFVSDAVAWLRKGNSMLVGPASKL
ncbi:NPD-domain-containing protein [Trichoderma longibrachiatum ATCC 18648]|uniref:NPD-domain-containing protein n=1 Tax=Trichoderma longibrachiatum ATCC 18648 TaxID=983965 RepID=A0A2T4CFV4_TRILO|nr:NPD-domain-containing protein [Trichoderma longibrachiatum ATCC 18648]